MVVAAADHYRLLGVARDATREQIAQAWRRRARSEHPDRRPGEAGDEAAARFRELAEAYRVLGDPVRRVAYDRILASGQPAARMPPGFPCRCG
jgi:curved DNA-binding protein CbpA